MLFRAAIVLGAIAVTGNAAGLRLEIGAISTAVGGNSSTLPSARAAASLWDAAFLSAPLHHSAMYAILNGWCEVRRVFPHYILPASETSRRAETFMTRSDDSAKVESRRNGQ